MKINLSKVEVEAEDLIPKLSYFGESNYDSDMLTNVDQVREIAFAAVAALIDLKLSTRGRNEYSIKALNSAAKTSLDALSEYIKED